MKNKFSINRVALLLQRYFLENLSREIIFWVFIIFLFTALDHRSFVILVMFISGAISCIRLQKQFFRDHNGMQFLLVPTTHFEKLTAAILINTVYHFIMILLSYAIGNLLVTVFYHYIVKIPVPVNWDLFHDTSAQAVNGVLQISMRNVFWRIFGYFALSQAIFMLGTLYFQKYALTKSMLSLLGIGTILVAIQLVLFKSLWDVKHLSNAILPAIIMINNSTVPEFGKTIINYGTYMLLPFLWIVSYFKLKEKQV